MQDKCALCRQNHELQVSHIIPRFVITWLKDSALASLRAGWSPNIRIQDAYKIPLLCAACEEKLSRWETQFSENLFLPVHQGALGIRPITYGPWALKCLVSISWRVAEFLKRRTGLKHYDRDQIKKLETAMERWRHFLQGEEVSLGPHIQHLLPLSLIENHIVPNLSPFMNRYIVGSVDLDVVRSKSRAYSFAKLGQLFVFGTIMDPYPQDWHHTSIADGNGTIRSTRFSVPVEILNYINEKANRAGHAFSRISQKQKCKIETSLLQNVDRFAKTELAKAMDTDLWLSGYGL